MWRPSLPSCCCSFGLQAPCLGFDAPKKLKRFLNRLSSFFPGHEMLKRRLMSDTMRTLKIVSLWLVSEIRLLCPSFSSSSKAAVRNFPKLGIVHSFLCISIGCTIASCALSNWVVATVGLVSSVLSIAFSYEGQRRWAFYVYVLLQNALFCFVILEARKLI
jgi:hypothetical protein